MKVASKLLNAGDNTFLWHIEDLIAIAVPPYAPLGPSFQYME